MPLNTLILMTKYERNDFNFDWIINKFHLTYRTMRTTEISWWKWGKMPKLPNWGKTHIVMQWTLDSHFLYIYICTAKIRWNSTVTKEALCKWGHFEWVKPILKIFLVLWIETQYVKKVEIFPNRYCRSL